MMILRNGELFILYNNAGVFLGNGDRDSIFRIFKKWGKRANGSRIRLLSMMENFKTFETFRKHAEYVKDEWLNNRDVDAEELMEEAIVSATGVEFKKAKKVPRVLKSVILSKESEDISRPKILRAKIKIKKKSIIIKKKTV